MDFFINMYAKAQGVTVVLMDLLPLIGAIGSILVIIGGIIVRAAAAHDPAGFFHAGHPTPDELAALTLSAGVIRAHFKHQENVAAIAAVAQPGTGANPNPSQGAAK